MQRRAADAAVAQDAVAGATVLHAQRRIYTACSISGVRLEGATRAILPFVAVLVVDLAILSVFPQIALFLPERLGF